MSCACCASIGCQNHQPAKDKPCASCGCSGFFAEGATFCENPNCGTGCQYEREKADGTDKPARGAR